MATLWLLLLEEEVEDLEDDDDDDDDLCTSSADMTTPYAPDPIVRIILYRLSTVNCSLPAWKEW